MYFGETAILQNFPTIIKYNENTINSILKEFSDISFDIVKEDAATNKDILKAIKEKLHQIVEAVCTKISNFINKIKTYIMNIIAHSKTVKDKYFKLLGKINDMGYDFHKIGKVKEKHVNFMGNTEVYDNERLVVPNQLFTYLSNLKFEFESIKTESDVRAEIIEAIPAIEKMTDLKFTVDESEDGEISEFSLRRNFNNFLDGLEEIVQKNIPILTNLQKSFKDFEKKLSNEFESYVKNNDGKEDQSDHAIHNFKVYTNILNELKPMVQTYMKYNFMLAKVYFSNMNELLRIAKRASKENGVEYDFDDFDDFEDDFVEDDSNKES